jgi:hypothetical protein
MKHVIEAGTDGAAIAAFDAAALPADFDQRAGDDPADLMEMLQAQGRMWSGGTGGDGSHIVHVLIDEQSSTLEQSQPAWRGPINLPSGRLWVCGAEYVANQPDKGSAFTPKGGLGRYSMGGHVDLKPGVYDMTVFGIDNSDAPTGSSRVTAIQLLQVLPPVLLVLGGLAVFFAGAALVISLAIKLVQVFINSPLADKGWHALPVMLASLAGGGTLILAGRVLGRKIDTMPAVARDRADYQAARAERPDFVFMLQRTGDAATSKQR